MEKITKFAEFKNTVRKIKSIREAEKRKAVTVCGGTGCQAYGCEKVADAFQKEIRKQKIDDKYILRRTGCHGFCERGPIVVLHPEGIFYQKLSTKDVPEIVSETLIKGRIIDRLLYCDPYTSEKIEKEGDVAFYKRQMRLIFGQNGLIDPASIEDYLAINGYEAFIKVLFEIPSEEVINIVKKSGLRGRGGAGFPTGFKWEFCRRSPGNVKYVVCNADEGDPGAYMDRSLLEGNPHSVIEGMLIGAYAIGAQAGFIYVRKEYPLAIKNLKIALVQTHEFGLLGTDILGSGFSFDIKIVKGAGAFVCGEETALMASVEGKKGEPRQRPPFPVIKGLWKKPTNINNVETWANVPLIINRGHDFYSGIGTAKSKGTKIFSLVGKIKNTGLVEVPMGIRLSEIIYEIGGGIPKNRKFKAVQTGGPSGGCIPTSLIDLPVDYEKLTEAGSIMGSGGMIVMDENTCMVDVARYFLNFLKDESCGKCFSCREGIKRMLEIVTRITEGNGREGDIALLKELAEVIKDTTMCGLGQTAPNPVLSTLRYFESEYNEHIRYKKCSAGVCKMIVSSPCQHACPIETEAPAYIALIGMGEYEKAFEVIRKDNPLPSVCGRVCHHPCELKCRASESDDPISIRALKRFATDRAFVTDKKGHLTKPVALRNEKVAVIGSGPCGLSAAEFLTKKGFRVTIIESQPVIGGMLALGIPEHRLPREVLKRDVDDILKWGIEVKTGVKIGRDIQIDDLFTQDFRAVLLATGAHSSMKLNIPGEDNPSVIQALDLLHEVNLGKKPETGRKAVVIGGGNAAIDAARVALRLGSNVKIVYRRTRNEMPAFRDEIEAAIEEGIEIITLAAPIEVISENGKVTGMKFNRMKLGAFDSSGRREPVKVPGDEFIIEADTIITAIGERADGSFVKGAGLTKWGTFDVNPETLMTNIKGVFAGGDAATGPATVIEAVKAGKIAADSIEAYINGVEFRRTYRVTRPGVFIEPVTVEEEFNIKHVEMKKIPVRKRKAGFAEVELTYDEETARKEAKRCLRCDVEVHKEEESKKLKVKSEKHLE